MHPSIRAVADGFGERIGKVLKAVRSKGSGSLSVAFTCRPPFHAETEPHGADDETSTQHRERRPFVLPKLRGAEGERTDDD